MNIESLQLQLVMAMRVSFSTEAKFGCKADAGSMLEIKLTQQTAISTTKFSPSVDKKMISETLETEQKKLEQLM